MPQVSEATLSPGEHLLIMLAERLLTVAPEFPHDLRRRLAAPSPGPLQAMTAALGDVIAGLEAADVLSPLSPVPARLAALCASLRISGHGIPAAPADDLPEPWLSLLAHYQRRKPDPAPVRDGYAAVAAALPELDGIRLALLGLHNTEGTSSLHVLARGMTAEGHPGPLGVDLDFPLSIWLRDSGGRWHAARPAGWHRTGREYAIRLQLVPPLPRSTDLDRGAGRRAVGRGPHQAAAPLGVPAVTNMPNGAWFDCLPSCEAHVPCGQGRHIVRWEAGALRLPSHPDAEAELVLAALGGEKARCVELAEAWGRHAEDLSVLAIGPRGPADEIAVSWDDVDAAAQASAARRLLPAPPRSMPMRLASPRSPRRPGRRPGTSRRCRTGSRPRGAGTTCCRCWRWGTGSRSG